ncbi:M12 family metallopeptidase [Microbulbifer sp. ANSA002]|uniref:M12 family metallopeptidase n=1 Tax=unclassified Microbulbifer TaxID=2619833 RepID=UPI00404325A1
MGLSIDKNIRNISYKLVFSGFSLDRNEDVGGVWPNGIVKYYVPNNLDAGYVTAVKKAMSRWELCIYRAFQFAAIKFLQVGAAGQGVITIRDNDSSATVGYTNTTNQYCGVNWRGNRAAIASLPHEIGHTLGLAHEHMRSDAPMAVQSTLDSLQVQTRTQTMARFMTHGSSFDGQSIMMYDAQAQALGVRENTRTGGCKITPNQVNNSSWNPSVGDLNMLSYLYDGRRLTLPRSFAMPMV